MEWTDLLTAAFTGPNAVVFGFLNVWCILAHRTVNIPQTWGFFIASAIGAFLGGLGGYSEGLAVAGVSPPVLMNFVITGMVVGAGSSTVIGAALSVGADKFNLVPVSTEKKVSEEIRNPMSPTAPKGTDVRTDDEKPMPPPSPPLVPPPV
jgi:hypothetical protein